jgi:hypothetical protein
MCKSVGVIYHAENGGFKIKKPVGRKAELENEVFDKKEKAL